jgi:hypothetical protein
MKNEKQVFCEYAGCRKEIPEERAIYVRVSGKFFCCSEHVELHHPQHQTRGVHDVSQREYERYVTVERRV